MQFYVFAQNKSLVFFKIALTLFALVASKSYAQEQSYTDHEKLIKQGLDRLEHQVKPLKNRPVVQLSRPDMAPNNSVDSKEQACFFVEKILVTGNSLISSEEINSIISTYLNQCLNLKDINTVLGLITNLYLEKGYVTSRAYIVPQDLSDGSLEVNVVEGFVEGICSTDSSITPTQLKWAFPISTNEILNIRDIEQGLENLNTLSRNTTTVALNPAKQQGGTEIAVTNQLGRIWQGSIGVNNYGIKSTGEYQLDANVVVGNFVGINDTTLLSASTNIGKHELPHAMSRSFAFSWSVPSGYWNFSAQSNFYEYEQVVVGEVSNFAIHGSTFNSTLQFGYTLFRNQTDKWDLAASLTRKESKNFIEDVFLETSSRILYVWDLSSSYRRALPTGQINAGIHIYKSVSWFDSKKEIVSAEDDFQFTKYQANLAYSTQFEISHRPVMYSVSANYLYSPNVILASEGLTVGGRYSVRGLSQSSLFGYKGGYVRNEFTLPHANDFSFINQTHYFVGLDVGMSNLPEYPEEHSEWVAGSLLGIRWIGDNFDATFSYARAIRVPDFLTQKQQEVDLSLRINF